MSSDRIVSPLLRPAFITGLGLLAFSLGAGILYSRSVLGGFPSVYDNYLAQGDELFSQGDYAGAAERYRIAAAINREDRSVLLRLGNALERSGRTAEKAAVDRRLSRMTSSTPGTYGPAQASAKERAEER